MDIVLGGGAGWRVVFIAFIPLALLVALPTVPGLPGGGTGERASSRRALATVALAVGVGALLVGLDARNLVAMLPAVSSGRRSRFPRSARCCRSAR